MRKRRKESGDGEENECLSCGASRKWQFPSSVSPNPANWFDSENITVFIFWFYIFEFL